MHAITLTEPLVKDEGGYYSIEASSLGLAPGEWPDFIALTNEAGIGGLFRRGAARTFCSGQIDGFDYWCGVTLLLVFND